MHAEYVALSAAMREMLRLKTLVKTVAKVITGDDNVKVTTLSDVFEDNNGCISVATLPKITPVNVLCSEATLLQGTCQDT